LRRAEYRIKGTHGLVLRVTASGAKSWAYWLKDPKTRRWRMKTLGRYPAVTLDRARQEAMRLSLAVADGEDPFARGQSLTLAALAAHYMTRHAQPKKRSADQDQRMLRADVVPSLGTYLAREVTKPDVVQLLDKISDRGAHIGANRTLALVRKLYNWAIAEGHVASNPAAGIPLRAKEEPRSRVLSDDEIRAFWLGLDGPGFEPVTADALRLQLLLVARVREVTGMIRDELVLERDAPLWILPKARAKGNRDVLRPLPPAALCIVRRRLEVAEDCPFVFQSPQAREQPLTARAPARAVQRAAQRGLLPSGFTPRDLRRTAATILAALGVEEAVTKRILGHAPARSDVLASVYNRHTYLPEMRSALERLEKYILPLVAGERNVSIVVDLRGGAR
jgi:integrase